MKRTLVNHGGIIQWKFVISNDDELMQYAKYKSIVLSEEFRQLIHKNYKESDKPDTNTQKVLKLTSQAHNISLVSSCDVLLQKLIMTMHNCILKGDTLVVNQAGGYCPWDDSCMRFVEETEENINIANNKSVKNEIEFDLDNGPILVLENQGDIPEKVEEYIHLKLQHPKFSYIKNIQFNKKRLPELIQKALEAKNNIFVVQTTLMDDNQVEMVATLMEKIPYKITFHINSARNLRNELCMVLDEERAQKLFDKHEIIQW